MSTGVQPPGSTLGAAGTAAAAAEGVRRGLCDGHPERDGPPRQAGGLAAVTEAPEVTKRSPRRPNIVARLAAGAGVVVAALTPIAVVVLLILHAVNALTFT
jgi:hypothetical protein